MTRDFFDVLILLGVVAVVSTLVGMVTYHQGRRARSIRPSPQRLRLRHRAGGADGEDGCGGMGAFGL